MGRETTLLNPIIAKREIDTFNSKMSGKPNTNHFKDWPLCEECGVPMNFILQLYKKDFPNFHFPDNKNLFQIFSCRNFDCPHYDTGYYSGLKLHYYFFHEEFGEKKEILQPEIDTNANLQNPFPELFFLPRKQFETSGFIPDFIFEDILEQTNREEREEKIMEFLPKIQTKIFGYEHFLHNVDESVNIDEISNSEPKQFVLQIVSHEMYKHKHHIGDLSQWVPYSNLPLYNTYIYQEINNRYNFHSYIEYS